MKKLSFIIVVFAAITFFAGNSFSQWRVNLYGGYGFDDNIDATTSTGTYFNGDIKGTAFYGGGFEYVLQRNYGVELLYMREDTDVPINYTTGINRRDTNITPGLGMNFILLAGNAYTKITNSPLEPFGTVMLGLAIFENKDPVPGAESSVTKLGYGFRLGTNIWVSPTIGIKIMGQLLSASQAFDGGFYIGTGGLSAGAGPESSMLQFGIGGGLTFKLGS